MKKSTIKKIFPAIIVILVILILTAILQTRPAQVPIPEFKFLKGRTLNAQFANNDLYEKDTYYYYSFEADYNDVIADANSEFSGLHYNTIGYPTANVSERMYSLSQKNPSNEILVRIFKNLKCEVSLAMNISGHNIPSQPVHTNRYGWITVEVTQIEKKNKYIVLLKKLGIKLKVLK